MTYSDWMFNDNSCVIRQWGPYIPRNIPGMCPEGDVGGVQCILLRFIILYFTSGRLHVIFNITVYVYCLFGVGDCILFALYISVRSGGDCSSIETTELQFDARQLPLSQFASRTEIITAESVWSYLSSGYSTFLGSVTKGGNGEWPQCWSVFSGAVHFKGTFQM